MADVDETSVSTPAALDAAIQAAIDSEPDGPVEPPKAEPAPAPPVAAADVKTDEPAKTPEPTSAVTAPSEPATTPTQPTTSKDYEDWLTKWGGPNRDPNVAAKASWEMNNRLAEQSRQAPPAPPEQPQAPTPPVVPQEIQRFDGNLRTLETQYATTRQQRDEYSKARDQWNSEINKHTRAILSGRLDIDKEQEARVALQEAVEQRDIYEGWINKFEQDLSTLSWKWDVTNTNRELMQRHLETQAREEQNKKATDDARLKTFGNTFFGTLQVVAKDPTGRVIEGDEFKDFDEFARKEALLQLGPQTDLLAADIPAFLRKVKADYLALTDRAHKRMSAQYAKAKVADAAVNAPEGPKAVAPEVKRRGFQSPQEVEAAIDAAFG